ncbi:MAG TPA: amino acid adenylation domain-containing protein, partial [Longimicrobiaceae bacterium]|nr:amino acid adenylation domain-containing protein [Longimicrobiaceae bacterium]
PGGAPLPVDRPGGPDTVAQERTARVALGEAETRALLQATAGRGGTRVDEVLLAALLEAVCGWTGEDSLAVELEGHGRAELWDDVDLTRTVGWFTAEHPLRLERPASGDPGATLRAVRERLRAVPGDGIGWGLLRHVAPLDPEVEELRRRPRPEVLFNYLGQLDGTLPEESPFRPAAEDTGPQRSPRALRTHRIEVNAWVGEGRLHAGWSYGSGVHDAATIERVAQAFLGALRALVEGAGRDEPAFAPEERAGSGPDEAERPPLRPMRRRGALPLSFAQQRIWFLHQLDPGSPAYNMAFPLRMRGILDVGVLARALAEVVRRHESLRTRFHAVEGEPVQVVDPAEPRVLPVVDLRGTREREGVALRLAEAEARRPFDLEQGPLLRTTLLRAGEEDWVLLFTLHHIVGDAWTTGVLVREVSALYTAYAAGRPSPLPELEVQYADFALWQRAWLTGEVLERQLGYWTERLSGAPPLLELPTARPRTDTPLVRSGVQTWTLPGGPAGALRALARREGATLFVVLLAGWQALLARYSGQTDVVVGVPVAGRSEPELEGLVGFFLNTLALRTDLSGDPAFREVTARVQEAMVGVYAHQDLPFERLLEALPVERSLGWTPVFQAMFNLINVPETPLSIPGLEVESLPAGGISSRSDVTLHAVEREEEIHFTLAYDAGLFEAEQMVEMLGHLEALLEAVAADPTLRLSALPLRPGRPSRPHGAAERVRPAGPFVEFPRAEIEQSIDRRFARQARVHGERLAMSGGGVRLTYAELDAAVDRVARAILAERGAGEERIGILLGHDAAMPVAVLAALRAGKTYVPLDPRYPEERLALVLADARPGALLTDAQNLASARRLAGDLPLLRIDAPGRVHGGSLPEVPPDRPAYILYTSGSTGRPKGVVQSHRNVLHHVRAYTNNLRIGPADRLTLFSSFAFDAAVMDIFGALLNGAALCPLDLRAEGSDDLARWLEREGITVFHSTPTVFRYLLRDRHEPGSIPGIRLVVLGGEEAGRGEVELFLRHFGEGCVLVNGLGPTESTLALQALLDREAALRGGPVPVGFPVEDTEVALVNAAGEQPAVYGTGEIVIRSAHVALGYWNRPDATRAAFRPGPEGDGRRAYHTGDLGRWLPDGSVQFLGRADHQVKVRGYRIEPGEVEAALLEHPEVREAAVTARPDPDGERQLVAYVVAQEGAAPGQAALRAHLRARLPEFMVPAAVVRVEALPRTPSGKTDRLALPDPEWGGRAARGQYRAPATPTEQMVAGLWAELLGLERVGADDDFFEVGGHSLRAMQAVSRLRAALGIELPVRVLFEAPTLAALAARVDAARAGGEGSPLPQIRPVSRDPRGALPLSFAQQRLWFLQQLHPGDTSYNLGGALRLTGVLDVAALEGALAGVVRRHEALRTRILTTAAGEGVQVVDPPAPVPLPLDDLAPLPEAERRDEARRRIAAAARQPFDLERGPMFRVRLLRLDRHEHVLAWTVHHVVSDAWSSGVLAREVSALYAAAAEGAAPELPELPVQYADYAAWQREHLSGEVLEAQLAHWRRELEGAPAALLLPTDRPRRPAAGFTGASESMVLPPALADRLARLAREEGATPFMALLAAWAALLARYAGEEDVVVGTPTAGRTRPELEGLIGFFVNTLAIRVDLSRDPGFRALLGRVRGTALGAFEHQELPFERLVDELGTERDLGRHPVFQVMFALQNAPEGALRLAGLTLAPLETGAAATPFELSLALREGPDGILAELLYAADLFEAATAQRMLGHYRALLERAAAEPDSPVAVLPLLAPAEREQLLEEWNGVPAPDAAGLSVVEMVWAQAARAPGATAVVLGERSLSYAELVGRADRLARRLRRWGAGPENRVAVLLDRSLELPVALLGTLRAGAAYVPVDPALPPERVSFLLEDTAAAAVITRADLRARLPETGAPVLHLEEGAEGGGDAAPLPAVDPASLAYVIHTSGSTGTPKGAMVEHRALAAFALAMGARLGLGPGDRMLQFAALGFDVVVEELFPAWTHGAAVVLHEADLLDAPEELLRVVERRGVTGLELPTAYWHEWVRALALAGERLPAHVRFVIIGGERVSPERLAEWARLGVPLVHVYGLTETTVTTTTLDLPAGDDGSAWSSLPIGRPVPGARVYLLDPHLDPVPVGVPGELCVGGAGVGRGYLGRPSLTAGRWVPDPFAAEAGARMYRTGDLARWLADGTIEFLGRTDHQVKVRGFRVEPGEVEAALLARPEVREAVVAARPAPGGGARLVGWLVPAEGYSPAPDALVRRPVRPELWPSHGEYPVYDDLLYRAMAEDGRRNAAYREALAEVAPGAVVLDVGTGGEAVLARLAVEAGARRVYAVEAMEASFRQARERVRELGLEDRIVVLHGDAATVEVPEPVDVCVSELLGCVGSSEGAVAALDSVRRWLKPEGAMVPRRCVTRIAAARLPDELHAAPALEELGGHYAGEVFGVVGHRFDLRLCVRNLPADHLLSPSAPFEELDFARPGGDEWEHEVELAVARGGRLDGFVAWIQLYAGERLGVDALEQESAWLPMFFPAFYPGVEVRAGDTLRVRCQSRLSDDGVHPDYRVSGVLHRPGRGDVPFAHHSVHHGPAAYPSPLHREVFGGEGARTRPAEAAERVGWGELRAALGEVLPGHMVPDALVALESLPLTRHGKLDRRALPDPEPSAAAGAYRAPEDATGATLAGIWATVLGLERVGADDNFFALGGDSILSIQVVARARAAGVRITPRQIFEHPTVAALARAARESAPAARGEGGSAVGEAPLTPVQRWFFEQEIPDRHHWNVAALLEPRERLDAAVLEGAVAALLEHHDALRARFAPAGEGWRQEIAAAADGVPVVRLDLAGLPEAEQGGALERAAAELQAALRLERGPLLRAALFERGEGRTQRVLLVVHHLVMDGVSWRVLMEDLEAACDALSRGVRPALPPRTTSWRHWAERLAAHADAPEVRAQAGFWTAAVRDLPPPLPLDFRRGPNLEGTVESVAVSLDPEETRALLQEVPPVYRTRVDEVLLAALARAFASWTGDARLRVELEGHGREELFPDVDLSRTVGWFTTQYPVLLDLRGAPGEGDALRAVKEQLRAVPGRGIGYGLLRYLSSDPELRAALGAARPPEVAFNYLGQFRDAAAGDGLFARAAEPTGPQSSPRTPRTHALTVGALVADDRLRAWFSYSPDLHERGTVEAVAGRFAAELRGVIEHCRAPGAGGYTPSDFTAVRLDQRSLDKILLQVKG